MRRLVVSVSLLTLAVALLTGAAVAQEATPAAGAPFMGETYVGSTSDPNTLVAVVVGKADSGTGERQVRAYLCNAAEIDVWLMGTLAEERLALSTEDGTQLEATLGAAGVEGMATLGDGTRLTSTAQPATGIAGLYTVAFEADGQVRGVSAAGGTLTGQVEAEVGTPGATPAAGSRLVMTLAGPEREPAQLEAAVILATVVEAGTARLIVLEDGRLRGKRSEETSDGQGFIDQEGNL